MWLYRKLLILQNKCKNNSRVNLQLKAHRGTSTFWQTFKHPVYLLSTAAVIFARISIVLYGDIYFSKGFGKKYIYNYFNYYLAIFYTGISHNNYIPKLWDVKLNKQITTLMFNIGFIFSYCDMILDESPFFILVRYFSLSRYLHYISYTHCNVKKISCDWTGGLLLRIVRNCTITKSKNIFDPFFVDLETLSLEDNIIAILRAWTIKKVSQ